MRARLRLAIPNKGRLVEPTLGLLHDAGLGFEEHERSLVARVQNIDLDILFVRTNDIVEFVGDGVADLGITGVGPPGRVRRRPAARPDARLRPVPARRRRPADSPYEAVEDLGGAPRRHVPPEHDPAVLRGPGHPGRGHPDLGRGRGGAPARARGGDRGPRVDRFDARR